MPRQLNKGLLITITLKENLVAMEIVRRENEKKTFNFSSLGTNE